MTDPLLHQVKFDEWAIDASLSSQGVIAFVPICGDEIYWGLTYIQDRSPGPLVGVVSQNGIEEAKQWAEQNPGWQIDYGNAAELAEATEP